MQTKCIVVVSPNQFFREGLRHVLSDTAYDIVAEAATAFEFVSPMEGSSVDLLIWGPRTTEDMEAEVVQLRIRLASDRPARLLVLMDTNDAQAVRRVAALGVDAILSYGISRDIFPRMLDIVLLGEQVFPAVLGQSEGQLRGTDLAVRARAGPDIDAVMSSNQIAQAGLTARETQILSSLVSGASNKSIARALCLTEPTVKAHVKGVLRKIGVSNRTQAAVWATRVPS